MRDEQIAGTPLCGLVAAAKRFESDRDDYKGKQMPDASDLVDMLAAALERAVALLREGEVWLAVGFEKAPALVIGIAAMLALLPLTVVGRLLLRSRYSELTLALRRGRPHPDDATGRTTEVAQWPADAWVELSGGELSGGGGDRSSYWIGRRMVRIGRDDDNDLQLPVGTVHRHHAVIHHTDDAEFMIKDLSSADGNGVVVNGKRVGEARLRHGDTVMLGEAVLKFHLQFA